MSAEASDNKAPKMRRKLIVIVECDAVSSTLRWIGKLDALVEKYKFKFTINEN